MSFEANTLADWLAHCEHLHSKPVDMTLERVKLVSQRLGLKFVSPVVSVAGTNGKGSTCAMLESIALQAGYRVGLYIKPHLVHFEERCRIGGRSVAAVDLLPHFQAVEAARLGVTLTYFEFTTLVILRALATPPLDLVILEVGLGGRLDAVNVVDADCSVVTSIALDHTELLGATRELIGREKAGILRAGRSAVISDPDPPRSLVEHALALGTDLWLCGRDFRSQGDRQQWAWSGRSTRYSGLAYPALRGANQLLNASGVLAVLESLRERLPVSAQAVRNGLAMVELPGRFQVLPGQPVLVLDVAHNPHAAAVLAQNLDQMGFFPRTHAVFGAMADKDIAQMLTHMAPHVDHWHVSDLPLPRAASAASLAVQLQPLLGLRKASVQEHGSPAHALQAAMALADPADRIIVFGSFLTVGGVLTDGLPRQESMNRG